MKDYGKIISIRLPTWLYEALERERSAASEKASVFYKQIILDHFEKRSKTNGKEEHIEEEQRKEEHIEEEQEAVDLF